MLRRDAEAVLGSSDPYQALSFTTRTGGRTASAVTMPSLVPIKSERLSPGKEDDPDSLHLVELADKRLIVQQFSDTASLHINLRSFAQDADYLIGTDGYTWSTAIESVWDTMSDVLGPFPGLPAGHTPDGVPENLQFNGVGAWDTLGRLLDRIGCAASYNPLDDIFTIIRLGEAQTGVPSQITDGCRLRDAEPIENDAARFPETIRVYFHNHYKSYGQERDTSLSSNWASIGAGVYHDVPTGIGAALPGTVLALWEDLPRVLDEDNNEANSSDLSARAAERAGNWIADQTISKRRLETFPGIVGGVAPGSQIKAVHWRAWGPDAGGTATEIACHPGLPRQRGGLTISAGAGDGSEGSGGGENFSPPDLGRRSYPNYPRVTNAVQAWQSGVYIGDPLTPNAAGLISGRVRRWVSGSLSALEECWIRLLNFESDAADPLAAVRQGDYFIGRLCGIETYGAATFPLYVVASTPWRSAAVVGWGKAKENWRQGVSPDYVPYVMVHPCDDSAGNGEDTGTEVKVCLPRHSEGDPNVVEGDVVAYAETIDDAGYSADQRVCASGYMDAKIHTVTMWADSVLNIRPGWAIMNGIDNAGPEGSGIDMTYKFPRAGPTAGLPGGSNTHSHTTPATSPNTTGITVDDHSDHSHEIPASTTHGVTPDGVDRSLTGLCTGGVMDVDDCGDPAPDSVLEHTVNDPGHTHDVEIPAGANVPEYRSLVFIERIDNSET